MIDLIENMDQIVGETEQKDNQMMGNNTTQNTQTNEHLNGKVRFIKIVGDSDDKVDQEIENFVDKMRSEVKLNRQHRKEN